ncbi:trigger factor [Rubellimicrobium thermophilum DSM 16684]|uniref:Trigger factor n=1 Tax=Rubellimicrobium thermophilum DSM 16684 TaxID=1123069 RepID=S9R5Q2_9RHOB|nr:trigger factor [Rubellimicrobium thermophilum]EPX87232.1 trigger factor [Rubellimicrobium thermophilum DSM 16684]
MEVTETLNEGLKRGYRVTVTAAELDGRVQAKLAEVQPQIAMKGFRKGKVPMSLLRRQHGPRLLGEAMQETIDGAVAAHLEKTGDRPAMQPSVKLANQDWKEGDDLIVDVTYETLPQVPEVDLTALSLTRLKAVADDAAVEEALNRLAESARSWEERRKGSKAREGDQVVIDFTGRIDGEAFEGGAATDYPLVLGSGSFIPGFEDQLAGVKAGEEKEVTVTFPENYGARHLAGKTAVFSVTVKAVKEPKPASVDDELAKRFGADDLEALKARIREQVEREYAAASRAVAKRALLDLLDGQVDFELPEGLVKAEAEQIAHQLWHEEHPEEHGHGHGHIEPTEDHIRLARRRVKLGLLLADIGTKAEVKVTDQELTQAVLNEARRYRGQERQFFEYIQNNAAARQQLQAPIFEDKVIDHIFATARVEEKEVGKDELKAAVDALDQE